MVAGYTNNSEILIDDGKQIFRESDHRSPGYRYEEKVRDWLHKDCDMIKNAIEKICGHCWDSYWDSYELSTWLAAILNYKKTFSPAALAITLCLSTKLEEIFFQIYEPYSWLRKVLGFPWTPKPGEDVFPFHKLKWISIDFALLHLFPSAETARINCRSSWTYWNPLQFRTPSSATANLRRLELIRCNVQPHLFETIVSSSEFRNLHHLKVYDYNGIESSRYGYGDMSKAICKGAPDLEDLVWMRALQRFDVHRPFGTFEPLSRLRSLEIDYTLTAPLSQNTPTTIGTASYYNDFLGYHLSTPHDFLPPGLETLTINNINPKNLSDEMKQCAKLGGTMQQGLDVIKTCLPGPPLKHLNLTLLLAWFSREDGMSCRELCPEATPFLRALADRFAESGITTKVWRPHTYYWFPPDW
ncbi:hypothetical protein EJ04DRAFT_516582 [Polyplosphaeria fusca]|uniref:Uncharacterized protein n=1 Tax=Polyplosphaeria fusca TaxID=682080 RepID=A0A9P4UX34_9PLEO|nr:hypothetical protein EJ04DRAFT_516582 [Polyplosphaeria fusca]